MSSPVPESPNFLKLRRVKSHNSERPEDIPQVLANFAVNKFDIRAIEAYAGVEVAKRFRQSLIDGSNTNPADMKAIEVALFKWSSLHNCIHYAHWFFPLRTGGSILGTSAGMKYDLFLSPKFHSDGSPIDYVASMPDGALFNGETDGSSFPNGGLRATHRAAAFTSWDRASPPFVHDGTCYIPCSLISHYGAALDEKTPLLRAQDAVNREGLQFLKHVGGYDDVKSMKTYLGWEQEFFIVSKEAYLARPDLIACGRTLMGAPPVKGQQGDINYFGAMPITVKACLEECQAALLKLGCPLITFHNEVGPGQHEFCPIFTVANESSDLNQIAMHVCAEIAAKHGLVFLFHEKPFAGVNGSGKHNNWSVGTDTGVNFFNPGKNEKQGELFTAALSCLAYGLNQHGAVVRGSVATAGNDHRLGAQEAPPAIISLYTGLALEAHVDAVINGGPLSGYAAGSFTVDPNCSVLNEVKTGVEDRNRTASFPFCGNRFEFRAVGSEQNCSLPMAMVNTVFADGLRAMNELLASGKSLRDATAQLFQENRRIIFCGNGYSAEWPIEAERRGLPNLKNSVEAAAAFNTEASKALFKRMNVLSEEEVDARAECMFENYSTILTTEANCMVEMVSTGIEAAIAADLMLYSDNKEGRSYTRRAAVYDGIMIAHEKLEVAIAGVPHSSEKAAAEHCLNAIKPAMEELRTACDSAEKLVRKDLWPFPGYSEVCFGHHMSAHK